jgi:protease II
LETKNTKTISVDNQVGEILPGLNSDYESTSLNFTYSSPFVFQQIYKYNHQSGESRLVKDVKLKGTP